MIVQLDSRLEPITITYNKDEFKMKAQRAGIYSQSDLERDFLHTKEKDGKVTTEPKELKFF